MNIRIIDTDLLTFLKIVSLIVHITIYTTHNTHHTSTSFGFLLFSFIFLSIDQKRKIENLKSVIAKQENRCMELEKTNADIESKRKQALTDVKTIEEKLSKQESLVRV